MFKANPSPLPRLRPASGLQACGGGGALSAAAPLLGAVSDLSALGQEKKRVWGKEIVPYAWSYATWHQCPLGLETVQSWLSPDFFWELPLLPHTLTVAPWWTQYFSGCQLLITPSNLGFWCFPSPVVGQRGKIPSSSDDPSPVLFMHSTLFPGHFPLCRL